MKKRVETNIYKDRAIAKRFLDVQDIIEGVQEQVDGKIETFYQSTDPSLNWTNPSDHVGDLWYRTTDNKTLRWSGTAWVAQPVSNDVFDAIDGKAQVFVSQPTPPYEVGDIWFVNGGEILTCTVERKTGSYTASDWKKLNKYTDDTKVNALEPVVNASAKKADVEYYSSTSPTSLSGGSWSTTAPAWTQGRYIWSRTKWTQNNGTITYSNPSCLTGNTGAKGDTGVAITQVINYYLATSASSGVTPSTSGWTTTVQTMTATNQYLWNYEVVKGSNGATISSTSPVIIGRYGQNGANGRGISSITEYYQVSSSNTTAPSTWSTSMVNTTTTNRYLWNYEKITYTDGATEDTTKRVIGTHGETGRSIATVTNYYLATDKSSGVTTSTSGWTTTIQTMTAVKQYLWNYEVIKDASGATLNTTTPVIIGRYGQNGTNGTDGADGKDGKEITSITEYYQVSSSNTSAPTGSWSTSVVNTTTTNRYLWNYERFNYSDGTYTDTTKRVIGTHGETGASAVVYELWTSDDAVVKNAAGILAPSSITFTGKSKTGNGNYSSYSGRFKIEESTNGTSWTVKYTSSSNEASKAYTLSANTVKFVRCTLYLAGGTSTVLDTQTVPVVSDGINGTNGTNGRDGTNGKDGTDGKDAYTIILTNENHTFAGGTSAAIAGTATCNVIAYKGATRIPATIGTISGKPTGMSSTIYSNSTTSAYFTVSVTTSMTTKNGTLTVPITVDGSYTFNMVFTYSLALTGTKGDKGDTGVGITSITELYYCSSSSSKPSRPTSHVTTDSKTTYGAWNKSLATWTSTYKYYYTCSEVLYDDGTYYWSDVTTNSALSDANATANTANTNASAAAETASMGLLAGTSGSSSSARIKVVTCPDAKTLTAGMRVLVTFSNSNIYTATSSHSSLQLNVNSLGAKDVYIANKITGYNNEFLWSSGAEITFVYNGTYWIPEGYSSSIYGVCETGSSTTAKVVSSADVYVIAKGVTAKVQFTNSNTASNATLNLGSTSGKTILAYGSALTSSSDYNWTSNSVVDFTFDGLYWRMSDASAAAHLAAFNNELNQKEIFDRLTSASGTYEQGLYIENNKVYLNLEYLQGGIAKFGGSNNGNGVLEIYNDSGTRTGRWDKDALYLGNVSNDLTSPNIKLSQNGNFELNSVLKYSTADYWFKVLCEARKVNGSLGIQGYMNDNNVFNIFTEKPDNTISDYHTQLNFPRGVIIYAGGLSTVGTNDGWYTRCNVDINKITRIDGNYQLTIDKNAYVTGNLRVDGTKNRVVGTKDYGERLLYSYETPAPSFGDIGEGVIGEDGLCYVFLDAIFEQTITTSQYQVFLQAYGEGSLYVKERKADHFVVAGTPGMSFGWELKARQKDFDTLRLDRDMHNEEVTLNNETNYATEAANHLFEIKKEREGTNHVTA